MDADAVKILEGIVGLLNEIVGNGRMAGIFQPDAVFGAGGDGGHAVAVEKESGVALGIGGAADIGFAGDVVADEPDVGNGAV